MSQRYKLAKALGREKLEQVVKEDSELLERLGVRLLSIEQGLRIVPLDRVKNGRVNPWDVMTIEERTWDWLRPILVKAGS